MFSPSDALEVYYQNSRVGWLGNFAGGSVGRMIRLTTATDSSAVEFFPSDDAPVEEVIEDRVFRLTDRKCSFDHFRVTDDPMRFRAKLERLPHYATKEIELSRDVMVVTWKALDLDSFDDLEWVFEHPCFIPEDTEEDRELAIADAKTDYPWTDDLKLPADLPSGSLKIDWGFAPLRLSPLFKTDTLT
jgi:hypothetical protein